MYYKERYEQLKAAGMVFMKEYHTLERKRVVGALK